MPNNNFKETGKQIPINENELIQYVHFQIDRFNELKKATNNTPDINPYTDMIPYTTKDGKMIAIPKTIQQKALQLLNPINTQQSTAQQQQPSQHNYEIIIMIIIALFGMYLFIKKSPPQ